MTRYVGIAEEFWDWDGWPQSRITMSLTSLRNQEMQFKQVDIILNSMIRSSVSLPVLIAICP